MPRTPKKPPNEALKLELAKHKLKLQSLRRELDKLKRSGKYKDDHIVRLQMANDYLLKTGEPKPSAEDDE